MKNHEDSPNEECNCLVAKGKTGKKENEKTGNRANMKTRKRENGKTGFAFSRFTVVPFFRLKQGSCMHMSVSRHDSQDSQNSGGRRQGR